MSTKISREKIREDILGRAIDNWGETEVDRMAVELEAAAEAIWKVEAADLRPEEVPAHPATITLLAGRRGKGGAREG